MITGLGTDIVATETFGQTSDGPFVYRIFTAEEIAFCTNGMQPQREKLAGRYAAKEAFIKAMGPNLFFPVSIDDYRCIEVKSLPTGAPEIHLSGRMLKSYEDTGADRIWISISHEPEYAVATVILEKNNV
ncbi:holo-ACP synthase [Myxococcota bacterium]|nr:holo-ACP synthase [Myxococcota bacterium]MBU1380554.1 holo-ACP synthase [Myxococcota bacterium]MBU1497896.1 holo-ACP synthase [Myxococcota bacterium]